MTGYDPLAPNHVAWNHRDDLQPIDLAPVSPSLRDKIARGYRELAAHNRLLGLHDLAANCEQRASLAEQGGVIDWSAPCTAVVREAGREGAS